MKKYILILFLTLFSFFSQAQSKEKIAITEKDYANQEVEMADTFRADGKIYVVVAVILAILSGIIAYLVVLDKKIMSLEKQIKE
ncbi:MAG: CcmD family protein [Cytophagales bacterium]|nr:MAG: CcmD family protein [Cytophagales bacterium]